MIEIENLTKKFDSVLAVDGLTLSVAKGEVFGFLGPNGAGKTTTVRMLCTLISKTSGTAQIAGYEIGSEKEALKIRRLIGLVPDNVGLYEDMTAYENLEFYGKLHKCPPSERHDSIKRLLEMLGLWEKRDLMAGTFSKGMKQKLAIARALVHDPEVLFMDEPTANLDPESAKTVREFILKLKSEGKTIFLNTHNLDEAQRICDRIAILNTRMRALGTPEDLERSVGGRRTVIDLETVNDAILDAVRALSLGKVSRDDNILTLELADPQKANPAIVRAIVGAGGNVRTVSVSSSTLEETYLKLVRDRQ